MSTTTAIIDTVKTITTGAVGIGAVEVANEVPLPEMIKIISQAVIAVVTVIISILPLFKKRPKIEPADK